MSNKNMHQIMESFQEMTQMETAEIYKPYDAKEDEKLQKIVHRYPHEVQNLLKSGDFDNDLYSALYDYYTSGDSPKTMPYGTQTARDGDPYEWIYQAFTDAMDSTGASPYQAFNPAGSLAEAMDLVTNEAWEEKTETPKSEQGKYQGKTKEELLKQYRKLKASGPHEKGSEAYEKMKELGFAVRAKSGWGKVKEDDNEFKVDGANQADWEIYDRASGKVLHKFTSDDEHRSSAAWKEAQNWCNQNGVTGDALSKLSCRRAEGQQVDEGISSIVDFFAKKYQDYSREDIFKGLQKAKREIGDVDTDSATDMVLSMILGKQQPQAAMAECGDEDQITRTEVDTVAQERNPLDAIVALANIKPVSIVQRPIDMEEEAGVITQQDYKAGLAEGPGTELGDYVVYYYEDEDDIAAMLYNTSLKQAKVFRNQKLDPDAFEIRRMRPNDKPGRDTFVIDPTGQHKGNVEESDDDYGWNEKDVYKPVSATRKVSGTRYGGSAQAYEPFDMGDEEDAAPRGRGRPSGIKTKIGAKGPSQKSKLLSKAALREGDDAVDVYDEYLDETYPVVKMEGTVLYPSTILRMCDPVAYRIGSNDFLEAELGDDFGTYGDDERSEEDGLQESAVSRVLRHASFLTEGKVKAAKPDFLDIDKDGNKKEPMKKAVKQVKEATKPDFLDIDKDGNKKEPMKKAVKQVKEGEKKDGRYSIQKEYTGKEGGPQFVLRFAGDFVDSYSSAEEAKAAAKAHKAGREHQLSEKQVNELSPNLLRKAANIADKKGEKAYKKSQDAGKAYWTQSGNLERGAERREKSAELKGAGLSAAKTRKAVKNVDEESTTTRDSRAERAGKRVAKDIEYDEKVKDKIHGKKRGAEDSKAERAGKRVAKDIEHDEKKPKKVKETTCAGSVAPAAGGAAPAGGDKYGFGKGIYEGMDFERAFKKELKQLNEGLSININVDNSGQKSINVSATDEDADHLAEILKMAGMGGMSVSEAQVCETCGSAECECAMMENDELANGADDTEVANTDTLVNQYSGGWNGQQKQINPNNRGDNPMSMKDLGGKAVDLSESAKSFMALIDRMKK